MSADECRQAMDLGRFLADEVVDAGADIVIAGDMGIGNTTAAAALVGTVTGSTATEVTGRGTGIDDEALARKVGVVDAAMGRADADDPIALLANIGGPDFAAMAGFLLESASRGVPIILDGIVSCATALVAREVDPGVASWWVAGHRSTEPAATRALAALGLEPVLDLDLRLGEGTGALLALPILNAAALTLAQMATFEGAGVSDRPADA